LLSIPLKYPDLSGKFTEFIIVEEGPEQDNKTTLLLSQILAGVRKFIKTICFVKRTLLKENKQSGGVYNDTFVVNSHKYSIIQEKMA